MNGEDSSDVSCNNFVSTISNYDDESYITNTSLTFPVTSDLDESVIVCMNAGMQLTCQVTVHSLLKVSINYIW